MTIYSLIGVASLGIGFLSGESGYVHNSDSVVMDYVCIINPKLN